VKDALVLVDAINDFRHEDGDVLLTSFGERHTALSDALMKARAQDVHVVYANDNFGVWDDDALGYAETIVWARVERSS
jgi:nicotinamidase-related amidase